MQTFYATPADWETYRETITRLYLDEKRPLHEVMEYMALNHSFIATCVSKTTPREVYGPLLTPCSVKMYRSRFRKWGLDKNHKAVEVACMLKLKKHRDAAGKDSAFFIRNRRVDW